MYGIKLVNTSTYFICHHFDCIEDTFICKINISRSCLFVFPLCCLFVFLHVCMSPTVACTQTTSKRRPNRNNHHEVSSMYVDYGQHFQQSMYVRINRVWLPILPVVSGTGGGKKNVSPFAPEKLVSRDRSEIRQTRPVSACSFSALRVKNMVLTHGIPPAFCETASTHNMSLTAIGSVPIRVYRGSRNCVPI